MGNIYFPKRAVRQFLTSMLPALVVLLSMFAREAAAGQTVKELVESPALPPAPDMIDWDSTSRYFVNNVYEAIEKNKLSLAPGFIEKVVETHGDNIRVRQLCVHIYMRLDDWERAEAHLAEWLRLQPEATAASVRHAFVLEQLGRKREAREEYRSVLARKPSPQLQSYVEDRLARLASGNGGR